MALIAKETVHPDLAPLLLFGRKAMRVKDLARMIRATEFDHDVDSR